jgi:thioredoxin 1
VAGVEKVGAEAFSRGRLNRPGTWTVAFLADWCPFCRDFAPRFASLAARGVPILVADLSSEESPLWERFRIEVVPSVIIFRDGRPTDRYDGTAGVGLDSAVLSRIVDAQRRSPFPDAARRRSTEPSKGTG